MKYTTYSVSIPKNFLRWFTFQKERSQYEMTFIKSLSRLHTCYNFPIQWGTSNPHFSALWARKCWKNDWNNRYQFEMSPRRSRHSITYSDLHNEDYTFRTIHLLFLIWWSCIRMVLVVVWPLSKFQSYMV